jgi:hypothetical protein
VASLLQGVPEAAIYGFRGVMHAIGGSESGDIFLC